MGITRATTDTHPKEWRAVETISELVLAAASAAVMAGPKTTAVEVSDKLGRAGGGRKIDQRGKLPWSTGSRRRNSCR